MPFFAIGAVLVIVIVIGQAFEIGVGKSGWIYFTPDELIRTATGLKNEPTTEAWEHLDILVRTVLDPIRKAIGLPVVVTSGYRSEAVNQAVDGHTGSHHKSGYAADIAIAGVDPLVLLNQIKALNLPVNEVIAYAESGHVHVSAKPTSNAPEYFLDRQDGSKLDRV